MDDDESSYDIVPITISCPLQVFPYVVLEISLCGRHNYCYTKFQEEETEAQRGHKAINKRRTARIYTQACLNPKLLLSPLPPVQTLHNRPTIMCVTTAWQNSGFSQKTSWMGDPDGEMVLTTRNKFHHWNFWAAVSIHWYLCVSVFPLGDFPPSVGPSAAPISRNL